MPRRSRLILPDTPLHIIQRGNNRQACFFTATDYRFYLEWLEEYAEESGCSVHAYVLMTNHVHLLITPESATSASQLMKNLGQRYVQYINRLHKRSGTLWEGRYRSCITHEDSYLLACYRYIELNPVRAGMVNIPEDYPWSSYRINAEARSSSLITPHPTYVALGENTEKRCINYRGLFRRQIDTSTIDDIRNATNGNYVLGTEDYKKQVEKFLKCRVSPTPAGRPKKQQSGSDPNLLHGMNDYEMD